jgi:hypothetical protein
VDLVNDVTVTGYEQAEGGAFAVHEGGREFGRVVLAADGVPLLDRRIMSATYRRPEDVDGRNRLRVSATRATLRAALNAALYGGIVIGQGYLLGRVAGGTEGRCGLSAGHS